MRALRETLCKYLSWKKFSTMIPQISRMMRTIRGVQGNDKGEMTMRSHALSMALAISLLSTVAAAAADGSYTFTKIADTSGPFSQFDFPGAPAVNNAGIVAFLAGLDTGVGGIFIGDGKLITTIADSTGPFGSFGQYPSINARGTVAFLSDLDTGARGIFTGTGGPITTIAVTGSFFCCGYPSINARGVVAFHSGKAGIPGMGDGIFTSTGGSITTIVDTSGPFTGFHDRLSINDTGTIAFLASLQVGSPGIFTIQHGSITTIVDTSGPFTAVGVPSLNNAGTVAFFGCLDTLNSSCPLDRTAAQGIFTGDGGPLTTIVDTSGPSGPFSNFGNPSINNAGTVVFLAFLAAGGSGIFTGPDPVADKVITTGDLLFGFTVTSLGFLQGLGLNDAGQVAFFARLVDGTEGIYLATPVFER
jgi:hypothetical protein